MMESKSSRRVAVEPGIWHEPDDGKVQLIGMRCPNCGEITFPKTSRCLYCQNEEVEEYLLKNEGTVTAASVVTRPPAKHYRGPVPFAIGFVELEDELRVWTPLASSDPEVFKSGMEVELVLQDLYQNDEGDTVVGFAFTPKEEALR